MTLAKSTQDNGFSVFGSKPKDAILVPEMPLNVRNNCQSGKWCIGDEEYGSKCSMTILKFSKFFGTLGQTSNAIWGQVWFVAESGELPQGVVMVTYIKSRTLSDFNRLITEIQSQGIEPATGLFIPDFTKHSGSKPDENGIAKPINYYSLKWTWQARKSTKELDKYAAVLSEPGNNSRMLDMDGTRQMVCMDNLDPESVRTLLNSTNETAMTTTK
ncbi:MAG: hypothetical protein WBA13_01305 [Microcoleaceae cyanobacterium]